MGKYQNFIVENLAHPCRGWFKSAKQLLYAMLQARCGKNNECDPYFASVEAKFEDIFDVDHFIDYLKDDVQIVRDIPEWFSDKTGRFSSITPTVKNIPKYTLFIKRAKANLFSQNKRPKKTCRKPQCTTPN